MRKFAFGLAGMAGAALMATGAHAQSSKFAAAYDTDGVLLAYAYECQDSEVGSLCDTQVNSGLGFAGHLATIKAPQGKELLIGLSGVPILLTYTEAKGKNGEGPTESVALAGVGMAVAYDHVDNLPPSYTAEDLCTGGDLAEPGIVPMSVRLQYIAVDSNLTASDNVQISGDVTVALGLLTAAAHHFNFLAPDLPQSGDYAVAACFVGGALADVLDGKEGESLAVAALGKRILTVQEVRAIKGAEFEVDTTEW